MARFEGFPPPTTKKIHVCTPGESKGVDVAVNRHNYRSFDALLEDLSRRIPKLNYGARRLFTADGNDEISKLDQLEHEKTYICTDKRGYQSQANSQVPRVNKYLNEFTAFPLKPHLSDNHMLPSALTINKQREVCQGERGQILCSFHPFKVNSKRLYKSRSISTTKRGSIKETTIKPTGVKLPVQRTKSLTKLGDSHNGEEKKHHMKVKKSEKLHNGNHAPATTTTDSSTQYDDTRKSSSAQWDMSFAQPVSVGTTCTLDDEEKHAEKHVATDEEN